MKTFDLSWNTRLLSTLTPSLFSLQPFKGLSDGKPFFDRQKVVNNRVGTEV